jgi:hypothetical protein
VRQVVAEHLVLLGDLLDRCPDAEGDGGAGALYARPSAVTELSKASLWGVGPSSKVRDRPPTG